MNYKKIWDYFKKKEPSMSFFKLEPGQVYVVIVDAQSREELEKLAEVFQNLRGFQNTQFMFINTKAYLTELENDRICQKILMKE